jgi:hypothetical protein
MEHEVGRTCNTYEEMRKAHTISVGKLEDKILFTRPTRAIEDNIKMNIKEIVSKEVDWNLLAQDITDCPSLINTATKFMVP